MPNKTPEDSKILASLGLDYLTINEAAELMCKSEYYQGNFEDIKNLDEDSFYGEELAGALAPHIEKMIPRLLQAVSDKTLPAVILSRNFDESLIAEETHIKLGELEEWLDERAMWLEMDVESRLNKNQGELFSVTHNAIAREKFRQKNQHRKKSDTELEDLYYRQKIRALEEKVSQLEDELKEKPLNPKAKNSLLIMLLTMAIKKYRHDPKAAKNSSTANIISDVNELGMTIEDDTVRGWLRKAAELLEGEYELPNPK